MIVTISDATVSGAALTVAGSFVWAVRAITTRLLGYFDRSEARQDQILEIVKATAEQMAIGKILGKMFKAVQKLDSKIFTCDACGGWEGPAEAKPKGVDMCDCPDTTTSPGSKKA